MFGVSVAYLTRWPWRPFTILAAAGGLADEGLRGWGEWKEVTAQRVNPRSVVVGI